MEAEVSYLNIFAAESRNIKKNPSRMSSNSFLEPKSKNVMSPIKTIVVIQKPLMFCMMLLTKWIILKKPQRKYFTDYKKWTELKALKHFQQL